MSTVPPPSPELPRSWLDVRVVCEHCLRAGPIGILSYRCLHGRVSSVNPGAWNYAQLAPRSMAVSAVKTDRKGHKDFGTGT